MNQGQRKQLATAIQALGVYTDADACLEAGYAKVLAAVEESKSVFQEIADEEREKFDNMPEGLQQGDRAAAMEEAADALEAAVEELDNIDLSEHVAPEEGWADDVSSFIEDAIDNAESF